MWQTYDVGQPYVGLFQSAHLSTFILSIPTTFNLSQHIYHLHLSEHIHPYSISVGMHIHNKF